MKHTYIETLDGSRGEGGDERSSLCQLSGVRTLNLTVAVLSPSEWQWAEGERRLHTEKGSDVAALKMATWPE
jgi:hypothetical protein